jgi:hypothetical protein
MILGSQVNPSTGLCLTGIQDGGEPGEDSQFVLGDTFMNNVLTTFDLGGLEMRFTARA